MTLDSITPMILAWNEAANIERCLEAVRWADRVLVIDAMSTDATLEICAKFSNVEVIQREFDTFAAQANFGLSHVRTEWVLSLDADYVVPSEWSTTIGALGDGEVAGYSTPFVYCVFGRPLRGSVYPPRTTLYRRAAATYENDGHAHRVRISGPVQLLDVRICHDDRKPLSRWFMAQVRYAREEADKLASTPVAEMTMPDRIRCRIILAPALMSAYCLFVRGCILDGWPGWYYVLQRACAETMLSIELLDRKLRRTTTTK